MSRKTCIGTMLIGLSLIAITHLSRPILAQTSPFTNLSATLSTSSATFSFTYAGSATYFYVDLSTVADMSWDVYGNFAEESRSPIIQTNPTKWGQYVCGKTLYWRVRTATDDPSAIQSATVACTTPTPTPTLTPTPTPRVINDTNVNKSVLLLVFDPILETYGNKKVSQYFGWNDPNVLTNGILAALPAVSNKYVSYTIRERIDIDGIFHKSDGYQYTDESYVACIRGTGPCHSPDIINYQQLFNEYNICSKNVDEVWMWGGPYFGYWEFALAPYCGKTTFTMGFSYERQLAEALHDFGHRMEHVGIYRVGNGTWQQNEATEWNRYSMIAGHCGNIHYPPGTIVGSEEDKYDKTTPVTTDCDGYRTYPNGPFTPTSITCTAWSCTPEGYMRWWLSHIPNATGVSFKDNKFIYNNWWKYYAWYDETRNPIPITCNTADIDQNGNIDLADLGILKTDYLSPLATNIRTDINKDGVVDLTDYSWFVLSFGSTTGPCQ